MKIPTVAIVGRPNVGKSTLFNRIVGKRISIVEDTPGVTRDRIYAKAKYYNHTFNLIDTGGIDTGSERFNDDIKVQAEIAMDEADIILFVVDGKEGLTSNDHAVCSMLFKTNKKVIIVVNKMDVKEAEMNLFDFYSLGFENIMGISSSHNIGMGELLDEITKDFTIKEEKEEDDIVKFALIGRPNVGKSSLINAMLNEERVIVSNIAGTTRDSIDTPFNYDNRKFIAIDTAGLRKNGKIYEAIEKYSLIRSLKSIDRSDVCVLLISAEDGIIEYDKHIAGFAVESNKAIVIVVNKWDTINNDETDTKKYSELIRAEFKFIPYAPIVFLSALTKKRVTSLMPEIIKVYDNYTKEVKTSILNNIISEAVLLNAPPSYKGRRLKIKFVSQYDNKCPKFDFQVNDKNLIHFSYKRYLENKLRESIDFSGTPVVIKFNTANKKD